MKVMVTLPTYNEADNIEPLIAELLALRDELEVVVVDDDSPDGTWRKVAELAQSNKRVHLIHRTDQRGRGSAGVVGFKYAMEAGAEYIVEMDADFSHQPRFLPALLQAAENADVVVGSRLIKGGGESGRKLVRNWITRLGNLYARLVLGVRIRDCTSGYRVFRRAAFEAVDLDTLTANGPAIIQETLMACHRKGLRICEAPIWFEERRAGDSTFNWRILLSGFCAVWRFRFRKW